MCYGTTITCWITLHVSWKSYCSRIPTTHIHLLIDKPIVSIGDPEPINQHVVSVISVVVSLKLWILMMLWHFYLFMHFLLNLIRSSAPPSTSPDTSQIGSNCGRGGRNGRGHDMIRKIICKICFKFGHLAFSCWNCFIQIFWATIPLNYQEFFLGSKLL